MSSAFICTTKVDTLWRQEGASSHDIQNGILEPNEPDFEARYWQMRQAGAMFRVSHHSWWAEEMPSEAEYAKVLANLQKGGGRTAS